MKKVDPNSPDFTKKNSNIVKKTQRLPASSQNLKGLFFKNYKNKIK
jgi:hypothetical protein